MAVLAVYILLALIGTSVCEEQRDAPVPPTPPTPGPSTTSTPRPTLPPPPLPPPPRAAEAAAAASAAAPTEAPPTPAQSIYRRQSLSPRLLKRLLMRTRGSEPPLYNYALQNTARLEGRSVIHIQNKPGGDVVEFCACDEKLYYDAMRYREFGAVERWCIEYPEDRRVMGIDDEDDVDDTDDFLRPQTVNSASSSSLGDRMNSAVPIQSTVVRASNSASRSFANQQTQAIHTQLLSRQSSSAACNPESALSESHALRSFTSQSVVSQIGDKMSTVLSQLPPTSGSQPEANWCERGIDTARQLASKFSLVAIRMRNVQSDNEPERKEELDAVPVESMEVDGVGGKPNGSSTDNASHGSDVTQEATNDSPSPESETSDCVRMTRADCVDVHSSNTDPRSPKRQKLEAITQQRQQDPIVEEAGSSQPPAATREPQPGPSGVRRPPSPKPLNVSFPGHPETRHPRYRESVIHHEDARSEIFRPVTPSARPSQPQEDLNTQLNRIFGLHENSGVPSLQQPEIQYCLGELIVTRFGTKDRPFYTVYVKCHRKPDVCPPPTVCSAVVDPFTVTNRKQVPFQQQVFSLMGDQHDKLEPAKLPLSTACFCAPPDYRPRQMNIFDLAAPV